MQLTRLTDHLNFIIVIVVNTRLQNFFTINANQPNEWMTERMNKYVREKERERAQTMLRNPKRFSVDSLKIALWIEYVIPHYKNKTNVRNKGVENLFTFFGCLAHVDSAGTEYHRVKEKSDKNIKKEHTQWRQEM